MGLIVFSNNHTETRLCCCDQTSM